MDAGRDEILDALAPHADDPRVRVVESLGAAYPSVLGAVDVVVGNSSSGIIEAATAHVPAVDIGARQHGRLRGANVLHADEGRAAVSAVVARALTPEHRALAAATANPYGTGDAAARVLDIVRAAPGTSRTKPFVDLEERA